MKIRFDSKRRKEVVTLIVVFVGVLLASALAVYLIAGRSGTRGTASSTAQAPGSRSEPTLGATSSPTPASNEEQVIMGQLFPPQSSANVTGESWGEVFGKLTLRLLLASLLGAALAFRPRRRILAIKRNPYVSQTQILLAVVASALMIVVGDNAARAFGIFAAVSLVRFRTNIRDPKEITVLLISLALGLATGVGRWDLALILTAFSLLLLWILEYREPELVFRSMELRIKTTDVAATHQTLREVFERHGFDAELRALGKEGQGENEGNIIYSVDTSPATTTDELSAEILGKSTQHIVSIEWEQKKSYSYLYQ